MWRRIKFSPLSKTSRAATSPAKSCWKLISTATNRCATAISLGWDGCDESQKTDDETCDSHPRIANVRDRRTRRRNADLQKSRRARTEAVPRKTRRLESERQAPGHRVFLWR